MRFYADLHVHSKYSRATSRNCDLEHMAWWARYKGITVVGTGDFTHPEWMAEIRDKLVPAEPGLFRLRPDLERELERRLPGSCQGTVRFLLEVEISTIYKKGEKTRKVHHLVYAPDLETADRFNARLGAIGNLASDGRPILGLDSRDLLEITLESGPGAYLVPAHIWTPWFAAMGSKSGFDSIDDCYGDLAEHIFAVETGLSSDPPMNWRISHLDRFTLVSNSDAHSPPKLGREACVFDTDLDYFAIRRALETREGYGGTVEFFPEEGKYHLDGHRACGVRLEPPETRRHEGRCPSCDKPLTVGVMHRVESLADRSEGYSPSDPMPYRSLVPLPEMVSEICGVGPGSKTVGRQVGNLVSHLGPELYILEDLPLEDLRRAGDPLVAEAVGRLRRGEVVRESGYDGEYGTVKMFEPGEVGRRGRMLSLFGEMRPMPSPERVTEPAVPEKPPAAAEAPPTTTSSLKQVSRSPSVPAPAAEHGAGAGSGTGGLFDRLDADQRLAAEVLEGPLLIVAGPGTGKTRTLTHRLAHWMQEGKIAPADCLAVTFTRRAAAELEERLEALAPAAAGGRATVATFHGLALRMLRRHGEAVGLPGGFSILDPAASTALARSLFGLSSSRTLAQLKAFEALRRQRAQAGELLPGGEDTDRLRVYEAALAERGVVDFDGLLDRALELLTEHPEALAHYRDRFRWISIDEYQDIDALQYRLVRELAPSGAANLCAIGDPDQSIYRFRGAEVGFFLRFQEDYPEARVVQLGRNYRSSRTIVAAAVQVIAPSSLVPGRELRAVGTGDGDKVGGTDEVGGTLLVVAEEGDARGEARWVVRAIEELVGGTSLHSLDSRRQEEGEWSFDDMAILYRTDAQSRELVEALERSGIPFQKRSHSRLADRPGVRELVGALVAAVEAGLEKGSVESRLAVVGSRLAAAGEIGAEELQEALELVAPLAVGRGEDLEGFLAELTLGAEVDTWDPRAERVSLLTLHAAKGLEFPVVFIVGCEDGLLPLHFPGEEPDLDEERRLLFVGLTRARRRLFLSWARRRHWRGEELARRPSPFLIDIESSLVERRQSGESRPRPTGPRQLRLL